MTILWFLPVLIVAFTGYVLLTALQMRKAKSKLQLDVLRIVRHISDLLENLPKHRGASSAVIKGDQSFTKTLPMLQEKIDHSFSRLQGEIIGRDSDLTKLQQYWHEICRDYNRFTAAENFNRHTHVISQVIDMLKDLAEDAGLLNKQVKSLSGIRDVCFNRMPPLIEMLGQARGLATMQVSQGRSSSSGKIKLQFLVENVTDIWQQTVTQLTLNDMTGDDGFQRISYDIGEFMKVITLEVITKDRFDINADGVFQQGTGVIEGLLAFYYKLLDKIEKEVQAGAVA